MTRMSKSKSQIWSWLKEIIKLLFIAFGCFISITHCYKLPWIIPNTPLIVSRLFGLFIMGHRGSDSKREMNKLCRSDLTLNFGLLKPYFQNHLVPNFHWALLNVSKVNHKVSSLFQIQIKQFWSFNYQFSTNTYNRL